MKVKIAMIVTMLSSGVIDYWDDGDDQPYFYYLKSADNFQRSNFAAI